MKTSQIFKFTVGTLILIISLSLPSLCQQKHNAWSKDTESKQYREEPCQCRDKGLWIPKGSIFKYINRDTISITPPQGYQFIYSIAGSQQTKMANRPIAIRCFCNSLDGSCNPFFFFGWYGCRSQGCSTCTSYILYENSQKAIPLDMLNSGFVNVKKGIQFITEKELKELPPLFPGMFEIAEIKRICDQFIKKIYRGKWPSKEILKLAEEKAPNGYHYAAVNMFGHQALMLVPNHT